MTRNRFPRGQTVGDKHIYVSREEDHLFRQRALGTSWLGIQGCRTMGKTSLVVRHRDWLEGQGCQVAFIDLGGWRLPSADAWLLELGEQLVVELGKDRAALDPNEAVVNLPGFLRRLTEDARHTLIIFDEVDWLIELSYGRELMAKLRAVESEWSMRRWPQTLTLGFESLHSLPEIVGVGVAPVISTLQLRDFPLSSKRGEAAVRAVAEGFPEEMTDREAVARRVLEESGGQPFQTMILATELLEKEVRGMGDVDLIVEAYVERERNEPTRNELFDQIGAMFREEPLIAQEGLNEYERLLRGNVVETGTAGAEFLLRSGLTRACGGSLECKGPIFSRVCDERWVARTRDRLFDEQRMRKPRWRAWSSTKPRICILNTGGTVGMVRRQGKVVAPRNESEFLGNYKELLELGDVDFVQPFVRDSINVYPEQWAQLAEAIYRKRNEGYSGFVVAHGTDTMAFSASAVAFALGQNLRFPVVFTGAQTTPDVLHGDAHSNLLRSCVVASKGEQLPEVVICFGSRIFRALRAQKRDERRFEGFESPSFSPLGEITEEILLDRDRIRSLDFLRTDLIRELPSTSADIDLQARFAKGVLMIQLTPGLEPDLYLPILEPRDSGSGRPLCAGVIIQTLGAGNVANLAPYSFTGFLGKASEVGIPVLITSPYPWSSDLAKDFAPAAEPLQLGAIVAGEMTAAAAAAKFRWAIAAVEEQIAGGRLSEAKRIEELRSIMHRNYLGEKDGDFWHPGASAQTERPAAKKENVA